LQKRIRETDILQTARRVLEVSMGVKPAESILIVSDTATSPLIAKSFFDAASTIGFEVMLIEMLPRAHSGIEPPRAIAEAMKNVDVVIAPTSKSLSHTKARMKCGCGGARMTTMPGITDEMMVSGGMTADYQKVSKFVLDSQTLLSSAKEIRITTYAGTDIVFDVEGCKWKADTGLCLTPGCCINLPAGEVYIAPRNAEGKIVVDGTISELGLIKSPLEITVENRYVTEIKGERADELKTILEDGGKLACNVAELGFGLNPVARMIGNALEDEKVGGTIHIGLGDSSTIGGDVVVGIHLDAIVTKPKIFADGKEVTNRPFKLQPRPSGYL
jgi:aminopeptidase